MPLFTFKDFIDILLVALVLYGVFRLLRRSGAVTLFWGLFAFVLTWLLVRFIFHLELMGALLDSFVSAGAIVLIVIFQSEIRSFFYHIGAHMEWVSKRMHNSGKGEREYVSDTIASACRSMARTKTGALIVLAGRQDLSEYMDTGERIDAAVSERLIENIFFKNTPLHDGALIVSGGLLASAACVLPLSARRDLPAQYGLRHRAALGIAEKTDAIAVVVSEETGNVAVAHGELIEEVPVIRLHEKLRTLWDAPVPAKHKKDKKQEQL